MKAVVYKESYKVAVEEVEDPKLRQKPQATLNGRTLAPRRDRPGVAQLARHGLRGERLGRAREDWASATI